MPCAATGFGGIATCSRLVVEQSRVLPLLLLMSLVAAVQ